MLRSLDELLGYTLAAEDGEIGQCKDFLFDDQKWAIRYMVADTATWLPGRHVLISPTSLGEPNWSGKLFPVKLTKEKVKNSPPLETDMPVSREYEKRLFKFYGHPYYWIGHNVWGYSAYPASLYGMAREEEKDVKEEQVEEEQPNHLRSAKEVKGYYIHATDDRIGHVEDFIVEDKTWIIRYIVVDTRNWLPGGKKVLVSSDWVTEIRWEEKGLAVDLSRDTIKNSPEYDPNIPVNREYEVRLYDFY
jgi:hypothetical protein